MNEEQLISIYIPTHNRSALLFRAVQSVLKQTYKNLEILISDDASSDDTQEICEKLMASDARIKYLRNETVQGACVARNNAIHSARGYFITGLDDDDEFEENRLASLVKAWDDRYSFLCTNFYDETDGRLSRHYLQLFDKKISKDTLMYSNVASNQIFTLAARLKKIGGFREDVRRLQDWDTWFRLALAYGDFYRLSAASYIMHHESSNKVRVSNSYGLDKAMADFISRNKNHLTEDASNYIKFHIRRVNHCQGSFESVYWAVRRKNPKYLLESIKK